MARINTVSLEFLRHGKAYNQLLSPLTQYLGLCGNHGASTVHVPYEQQEFLCLLKSLRYDGHDESDIHRRRFDLTRTAEDMAGILASVPGLVSSLGTASPEKGAVIHLDLVLSASELAMLPFELARVPCGCDGGEGNSLLLQSILPICLTRRVRSSSRENIVWPAKPKILFIIAQHRNMSVPALDHTKALLRAVQPWVPVFDPPDSSGRERDQVRKTSELLTILPCASMEEIEAACAGNAYSHVHILAHGLENRSLPGSPYGLALHKSRDKSLIEVVTGEQLASALRPLRIETTGKIGAKNNATLPVVVTVAACDSGNVGSVVYNNGASLAHALHQAGIPVVIASQFPLSKDGSVYLTQALYERMLWGEDPRIILHHLRSRLHALSADNHDWASLVIYAALPDNLEDQLKDVQYAQAKSAIDIAMDGFDKTIENRINRMKASEAPLKEGTDGIEALFRRVDEAAGHLPATGEYETEGTGLLASTEKRKAEICFNASLGATKAEKREEFFSRSLACLQKSMRHYELAYRENMRESAGIVRKNRSLHWVMVQYLSLRAVLGETFLRDHWGAAMVSAKVDLAEAQGEGIAWAHCSIAELYLILLANDPSHLSLKKEELPEKVLEHTQNLLSMAGHDSFPVRSTRRQFRRYVYWWGSDDFESLLAAQDRARDPSWSEPGGLVELAGRVVAMLTK